MSNESASSQDESKSQDAGSGDEQSSIAAQDPKPSLLEWTVRGISLLLIAALTGYVVWAALQPPQNPYFTFEVQTEQIEQRGDEWVVPIQLTNEGTISIEGVAVSGELLAADGTVVDEEAMQFELIGNRESKDFELWFDRDPARHELRFNVTGYTLP